MFYLSSTWLYLSFSVRQGFRNDKTINGMAKKSPAYRIITTIKIFFTPEFPLVIRKQGKYCFFVMISIRKYFYQAIDLKFCRPGLCSLFAKSTRSVVAGTIHFNPRNNWLHPPVFSM